MTQTTAGAQATNLRPYTTEQYIRLVESIRDPTLQRQMDLEASFLTSVSDPSERTFIDLGAGYGRVLPTIATTARNTICVELNDKMLSELHRRSSRYPHVAMIKGPIQSLPELLDGHDVVRPVLLILQNTLGTIEGDREGVLEAMREVAQSHHGSVVLSLFRAQALGDWGIRMYRLISEMVGEPDLDRTDFDAGFFVSVSGYTSKWWTDAEVEELKQYFGGNDVRELREREFVVFEAGVA